MNNPNPNELERVVIQKATVWSTMVMKHGFELGPEESALQIAVDALLKARATPPTPVEDDMLREIQERLAKAETVPWYSSINPENMRRNFQFTPAASALVSNAPSDIRYLLTHLSQAEAQLAELRASNGERFGADWANWKAATERVAELTAQVETIRREGRK